MGKIVKVIEGHADCGKCDQVADMFINPRGNKLYQVCSFCGTSSQGASAAAQAGFKAAMWQGDRPGVPAVVDPVDPIDEPFVLGAPDPVVPDKPDPVVSGGMGWKTYALGAVSVLLIGFGLRVKL